MPSDKITLKQEHLGGAKANLLPFVAGFYFAFRSFIMVLSVHLLGTDPRTGTGLDLFFDYSLILIAAFCTLGGERYPVRQMLRLSPVRWAFFFLGFTGLSLIWSSSASLTTSIAYWCGMAGDVTIVVLLLRERPATDVAQSLMRGFVWGACVVAVIAWIMPAQSDLRLGDEELLGANQVGYLCGFGFFFAQYLMREARERFGLQALLLAVTLLRTLSKTTIAGFLVSQGFLLIYDKSIRRRNKILIALISGIVVAAMWSLLSAYYEIYTTAGTQSTTLSGRIGIWAYFLAEAVEHPWIGHGFDSVWKVVPPFGPDQFEAAHSHNELLQQFYAYGLMGICMFAGIYFSFFRNIRRLQKGPLRIFLFALLLFVLVRGGADTERFDLSLPMWSIVLISLLIEQARATRASGPVVASGHSLPAEIGPQFPAMRNEELAT